MSSLLGVLIATMPYSAVVSVAFAPLVIGVLTIAVMGRRSKAKRDHH